MARIILFRLAKKLPDSAGSQGGGIYNVGAVTVSGSTLSGNSATYGGGGGIHNSGTLTVTSSTLSGNTASHIGGGIYNSAGATVTVSNSSRICGNFAPAGFGADVYNLGVLYQDITSEICDLYGPRVWI